MLYLFSSFLKRYQFVQIVFNRNKATYKITSAVESPDPGMLIILIQIQRSTFQYFELTIIQR